MQSSKNHWDWNHWQAIPKVMDVEGDQTPGA